jgi:2-polyprenyl-3-methyl-5-hydroxy-6-metoxy-1,4-benzoquinol methylase
MIIEKKLGIKGDYQFNAINSTNLLQRNWHKNKFDVLKDFFESETNCQNKTVLDLGTGSGNFELLFSNYFKNITGLDYNDEALGFLEEKLKSKSIKNVNLIQADLTKLNTKLFTQKYDYIIMVDVIEHLKIQDAAKLIPFFYDLLKKDGKVIIITPNYQSSWIVLEKVLDNISLLPKFEGEQHLAKYNTKNLVEIFSEKFNLQILSTFNTISYLFLNYKLNKKVNNLENKIKSKYGNLIFAVFVKKNENPSN